VIFRKEETDMQCKIVLALTLLISIAAVPVYTLPESLMGGTATVQGDRRVTVPAGTRILIRTTDPLDSNKQRVGHRFTANLETNLQVNDVIVAPRGTTVHGRLAAAKPGGRVAGGSQLTLELTDIVIDGTAHPILTSTYEVRSQGQGETTAERVVGGVGLGALIGGIAGGGRGAGIGAVAGAGTGAAASAATRGSRISIPSESLLEFRLEQPTSLPVAR
jgi:hypothetical protein